METKLRFQLPLVVVSCSGPTLLGRDWLKEIRLGWGTIFKVRHCSSLDEIMRRHEEVLIQRRARNLQKGPCEATG